MGCHDKDHKLSNLKTNIFSHSSGASSERKVMSVGLVFYRGLALWLFPFQLAILFFFPCLNLSSLCSWLGLPWWHSGNESACQCRIGTIPWSRKWLPTPGCMSGMLPGQRSLAGYSSWGHKETWLLDWAHPHCSCLCPDLPVFYFYFKYITLRCVDFCHTQCKSAIIIHTLSPSSLPLPFLQVIKSPDWTPCETPRAIQQLLKSCPSYTWLCVHLDATFSICPTRSLPNCAHESILYICLSIPSLQIGSSNNFCKFHKYASIYYICFTLSDFVSQALGSSTSVELTHIYSFLWLSKIPLCIYTMSSFKGVILIGLGLTLTTSL